MGLLGLVDRVNAGEGVGFKAYGTVVDKSRLKALTSQLYGALFTAFSILFTTITPTYEDPRHANPCFLHGAEADMLSAALFMLNDTCPYNISFVAPRGVS